MNKSNPSRSESKSYLMQAIHMIIVLLIVPSAYRAVHVSALSLTCIAAGQVLLNWLSSGNGPLLLSSRARAGMWTPEPVEMPFVDALRMTKGVP
jgi:hypothetical protein